MVMVWHIGERDGGVRSRWFVEDIIGMSFGSRISKKMRKEKERRIRMRGGSARDKRAST